MLHGALEYIIDIQGDFDFVSAQEVCHLPWVPLFSPVLVSSRYYFVKSHEEGFGSQIVNVSWIFSSF